MGCFQCICRMEGLQSFIRAKIMLGKQQMHTLKTASAFTALALQLCHCLLPVQVNEEAEEVIPQLNHALLHVGLELTAVMNLGGIKHAHVSHRNLYAPEGRARNLLHHLEILVCVMAKLKI